MICETHGCHLANRHTFNGSVTQLPNFSLISCACYAVAPFLPKKCIFAPISTAKTFFFSKCDYLVATVLLNSFYCLPWDVNAHQLKFPFFKLWKFHHFFVPITVREEFWCLSATEEEWKQNILRGKFSKVIKLCFLLYFTSQGSNANCKNDWDLYAGLPPADSTIKPMK